ncbi:hypothetical protein VPH46_16240 [Sphingomonas sp. MJ1 (PH-R8)]|uniref:hypothetical protein n=1 Tax=Sphingomonas sp. MJ1 (PH-R8) TaxID=3112950 RepID=UPI003A8C4EB1
MDQHAGRCGDDGTDEPCPICRGEELDPDFVAMIEHAAAQPGKAMTFDEAIEWLRTL